jgi:hypothetical protein
VLHLGDRVMFQALDIYLPGVQETLTALTEAVRLVGTVIEFSDSGAQPEAFAVVEIDTNQRVIVPVGRISSIAQGQPPLKKKQ